MKLKDKIIVGTSGGLGNQMFQYAAGLSLSNKLGIPLKLDISWHNGKVSRKYLLNNLNISNVECSFSRKNYFLELYQQYKKRFSKKFMGVPIFRERFFHFSKDFNAINSPVFLHGYWQSEKYFAPIRSILLKEFTLKEKMPDYCQAILNEISNTESVCVHIRRGDYESDQEVASIHGLCSLNYYYKCANEIAKTITSPSFFVFSDDPNWVKQNLNLNFNTIFVDINNHPHNPHYDLSLMMACKYFIIANSTYSWWGAWLSSYKLKKVYAPINWFALNKFNSIDLIPTDWIRR